MKAFMKTEFDQAAKYGRGCGRQFWMNKKLTFRASCKVKVVTW